MELIGKKVRGFKFESKKYQNLLYNSKMDDYIGLTGVILCYNTCTDSYDVKFEGIDYYWEYPAKLIEEHLVEETTVPETITLPLINGVPDLSEFEGVEMLVSDDGVTWHNAKVLVYDSKCMYPYISLDDRFRYANPLSEKKKITAEDIKKMFNCDDFEIV